MCFYSFFTSVFYSRFSLFFFLPNAFFIVFSSLALFEAKGAENSEIPGFIVINKGWMGQMPIPYLAIQAYFFLRKFNGFIP